MKRARKLAVVVQRGRIVGTQEVIDQATDPPPAVSTRLVAGPGQRIVELMVNLPDDLRTAKAIERFHASLLPLVRKARAPRKAVR